MSASTTEFNNLEISKLITDYTYNINERMEVLSKTESIIPTYLYEKEKNNIIDKIDIDEFHEAMEKNEKFLNFLKMHEDNILNKKTDSFEDCKNPFDE